MRKYVICVFFIAISVGAAVALGGDIASWNTAVFDCTAEGQEVQSKGYDDRGKIIKIANVNCSGNCMHYDIGSGKSACSAVDISIRRVSGSLLPFALGSKVEKIAIADRSTGNWVLELEGPYVPDVRYSVDITPLSSGEYIFLSLDAQGVPNGYAAFSK